MRNLSLLPVAGISGRLYKQSGKLELEKQNMEYAIRIIEQYDLTHYHDSIVQITNHAHIYTGN